MSYSIEIVKLRDILPVTEVSRFIPDAQFPTVEIKGVDLSKTDRVFINGSLSPEVVIINSGTVWAQLPKGIKSISSIKVVGSEFGKRFPTSDVEFAIGDIPKRVNGVIRLLQYFVSILLQTPGSDVFHPELGGGLQSILGSGANTSSKVMSAATQAVSLAKEQIRKAQVNVSGLRADERLLDASIKSINVAEQDATVKLSVLVESMAGVEASTEIDL